MTHYSAHFMPWLCCHTIDCNSIFALLQTCGTVPTRQSCSPKRRSLPDMAVKSATSSDVLQQHCRAVAQHITTSANLALHHLP